jgi:hypothetical protein
MFSPDPLSDYKKSLEDLLQKISFLYSGDVKSSEDRVISKNLKHRSFSADLMKLVLIDIYQDSISYLVENSNQVSVPLMKFEGVHQLFNLFNTSTNKSPRFLFYRNQIHLPQSLEMTGHTNFLPNYFYSKHMLLSINDDVECYYSPSIKDDLDDSQIIIVDNPIQSLVWTLQNMTYEIKECVDGYEHIINYKFYCCDFNSTVYHIKDVSKLRQEKINTLLNDN